MLAGILLLMFYIFLIWVKDKTKWAPPMAGGFKVNFDGAIFQEERAVGIGIVVRDESVSSLLQS